MNRRCSKCGKDKNLYHDFYRYSDEKPYSQCKECCCKYAKDRYWNDDNYRQNRKMEIKHYKRWTRRLPR